MTKGSQGTELMPWRSGRQLFDCTERGITFTRRPYRKRDKYFVEQKNWPVVHEQIGYGRYDTPEEPGRARKSSRLWGSCTHSSRCK